VESWASKGTSGSHSWRVTREDQEKGEERKGMLAFKRTYWAAAARMIGNTNGELHFATLGDSHLHVLRMQVSPAIYISAKATVWTTLHG
jgi:hypothetical protein